MVRAHASRAERSKFRVRLGALTEYSRTVHPAANGYLVATLGRLRRRGMELATVPYMPMAHDKCPL